MAALLSPIPAGPHTTSGCFLVHSALGTMVPKPQPIREAGCGAGTLQAEPVHTPHLCSPSADRKITWPRLPRPVLFIPARASQRYHSVVIANWPLGTETMNVGLDKQGFGADAG